MHLSGWPGEMAKESVLPMCVCVCAYTYALCVILVSLQQITYENMQEAILCLSCAIKSSANGSMGDAAI